MERPSLTAHYHHQFCNSTACPIRVSLGSECERELIKRFKSIKLSRCGKCEQAFYCCRECQAYDWKDGGHKKDCAELRADVLRARDALLPAAATKEYQAPAVEVSPPNEVEKVLRSLRDDQSVAANLLHTLHGLQVMMSDIFDRDTKGLPQRGERFSYQFAIPITVTESSEEMVEDWRPITAKFKSWMWRSSKAGLDFERLMSDASNCVPLLTDAIQSLQSWEPQKTNLGIARLWRR
jgi:MYND finger